VAAHSSTLADFAQRNRFALSDASSLPLYYQLYRLLERFIFERHLHPGDRFPAEDSIATAFDVSRPTANRATRELLDRGWLRRERGRGTFVGHASYVELALLSDELSLSAQFRGERQLLNRIIHCRTCTAPAGIAEALDLPVEAPVIEFRRLRSVDERPVLVSDAYLPASRFAGFDADHLVNGSLFATLRERFSVSVARCERWLEASELLSQEVADLLAVPLLAPILRIRGLAYAAHDDPIACMTTHVQEGVSFQATARSHPATQHRTARTFAQTVEGSEASLP